MDKLFSFAKTRVRKLSPSGARKAGAWKRFPSVRLVLWVFRTFYVWPGKDMDQGEAFRYRMKGIAFRLCTIYLSEVAQIVYLFTVKTREELFDGMLVLSTQLLLIVKMEFFYKNVSKIQNLFYQLDEELYVPQNAEEDVPLARARTMTTTLGSLYLFFSDGLVVYWMIISLMHHILMVPSWYPFDYMSSYGVFLLTSAFQSVCMALNASFNISWDSLVFALVALTNAHLKRLQIQLMKVGHRKTVPEQRREMQLITVEPVESHPWKLDRALPGRVERQSPEDVYHDLLQCIMFHQKLTGLLQEVLDMFGWIIFVQLCSSVFIICITEFQLLMDANTLEDVLRIFPYLMCMVLQVYQYCFHGNEIGYTSKLVHEATAFVNYPDMNIKTRKLLIRFQQRTAAGIKCYAKNVFKIELSMTTFVMIIKTSYSFLAVLRSMID